MALAFTVGLGAMAMPWRDTAKIIGGKLFNASLLEGFQEGSIAVVWEIRLPRIICGMLAGMGLAAAGVIFQAILQNPLADPYTLGISTGAAFGASIAIYLNTAFGAFAPIPAFALASALLTLLAVIAISAGAGGFMSSNLIMAGIIASSILSAGISFIKMAAGENVGAIVYWLMGSLSAKDWGDALMLLPILPSVALAWAFAKDLNAMALGSRTAESLGVNVKARRLMYLSLGAAITALCVSACGVIGFVGLIVPHLLRFWLTSDNRLLLPVSALLGAFLLSAADNLTRLLSGGNIPVGVLTTLLGGPFFIFIFMRRKDVRA
jgi:iron complex transport system permease protein